MLLWMIAAWLSDFSLANSEKNLVLVTLDGVRWEEVFRGADPELLLRAKVPASEFRPGQELFPRLKERAARGGLLLGNRDQGSKMGVSNAVAISLPAYQSILTGNFSSCTTNGCERVRKRTFLERLKRDQQLSSDRVVTVASWEPIAKAVESVSGTIDVSAGVESEEEKRMAPPWTGARFDRFTWARAIQALIQQRPRALYISLNDSDEWGHRDDYFNHLKTLVQYDQWLEELFLTLEELGEYGDNTRVLITTDHGRGSGDSWKDHGFSLNGAYSVWMFAGGTQKRKFKLDRDPGGLGLLDPIRHLDLRPTMEALLGMRPLSCDHCGKAIKPVLKLFEANP